MYAAVKAIATILSLALFIDRAGRRKLLLISSAGTSLALWYIGGFVTARHVDLARPQEKSVAGWVAIVCVYIYAVSRPLALSHFQFLLKSKERERTIEDLSSLPSQAFFSFAWNGVVWVYCAEIFPTRIKELAVCICTASQWLFQFAVARASPYMLASLKGGFFFFFASCIVVMGIGVWWLVPETKGRTLEGMDEVFGSPYGEAGEVGLELRSFRRERGVGIANGGEDRERKV
jgi:hypothetical protein